MTPTRPFTTGSIFSPVNEDVAAPDPGRVDEVVALRDELDDVLPRVVGRRDYEVFLVLNWEGKKNHLYRYTGCGPTEFNSGY